MAIVTELCVVEMWLNGEQKEMHSLLNRTDTTFLCCILNLYDCLIYAVMQVALQGVGDEFCPVFSF